MWSEPGLDDDGIEIYRVRASTEVLDGCRPSDAQLEAFGLFNRAAVTSALLLDEDSASVSLDSGAWVHEGSAWWMRFLFAYVAVMQAADAVALAPTLAATVGGALATSNHPSGLARDEPDADPLGHMRRHSPRWRCTVDVGGSRVVGVPA